MTLENLNDTLNPYSENNYSYIECESGWADLIYELHNKIIAFDPDYKITQIKEKFGLLRFYYDLSLDIHGQEIGDLVNEYEQKSGKVCEYCASPGRPASFGHWQKTCCEECLIEYKQEHPKVDCKFIGELTRPIVLRKN